jgi:CheY-like chemotaxis protein
MSIIREHGGNLEATAIPDGGSIFTMELPIIADQDSANISGKAFDKTTKVSSQSADGVNMLRDRSVLVVDDEESIRMLLEEGLSGHGLHADCAANVEEAIELATNRSYDILLCDLNLSGGGGAKINGREAAERILAVAAWEKPSVIFMTGDLVDPNTCAPGSNEPRLLQKPFRISDVLTIIREVDALKRLEKVKS